MKQNQEMPDWLPRATLTVLGTIGLAALGFWMLLKLKDLVAWIVISLFLSFAIEPLTNKLEKRGWKRGVATGVILAGVLLGFGVFIGSMVPLVIAQLKELIQDTPRFADQISSFLYNNFSITVSTDDVVGRITSLGSSFGVDGGDVASNVLGVGGRVLGGVFQLLTIALFTFYLVVDGPNVRRKVMKLMPAKQQKIFLETWEVAIEKMGGYLYVRLILAGLSTLTTFVVLWLFGVPFALPLALWMGLVSQFIPVVGTYIAAAIPLLVALLENPWSALAVLVYVLLYQQIENYLISPKLTARTMQLHPAVAIGAAIAGGSLYGAVGAFLALPAAAILQVVFASYIWQHEVIDDDGELLGVKHTLKKKRV